MIDTLDIACPVCDATYTADEEHDCTFADCRTCKGSGFVVGGDAEQTCPGCRLTARRIEADRIRAAAEDQIEGQWRALRDAGADETTLRAWAGDR